MNIQDSKYLYKVRCNEIKDNKNLLEDKNEIYRKMDTYDNFKDLMSESDFKDVLRQLRSRYGKRYRANQKMATIVNMASNSHMFVNELVCVFGTCTFNDAQFSSRSGRLLREETRTKKVNKYIKSHCLIAVVNIDYGEVNEREHHHFIGILNPNERLIQAKHKNGKPIKSKKGNLIYNLENDDYKLGHKVDYEIVNIESNDMRIKKVSNYLLKINNHTNKKTTKNRRFRTLYNEEKFIGNPFKNKKFI